MVWMGGNKAYEPAAQAVIAFSLTWASMAVIQLLARFSKHLQAPR
jgi:putative spermidine/putrescine transport system permease protein